MTAATPPVKAVKHGAYVIAPGEFNPGDAIPPEHGGTGLAVPGTANQLLGVNADGTAMEYKALVGIGMTIVHAPNSITFNAVSTNQTGNNHINQIIGAQ